MRLISIYSCSSICGFFLFAAELLARTVFDPVDYLLPRVVHDDFLFNRIEGYSGGHDAWGFRNAKKPETADIVCIGDSMTYGISARARDLAGRSGSVTRTSVYNMGVGARGPIEYLHGCVPKRSSFIRRSLLSASILGMTFWMCTMQFASTKTGAVTEVSADSIGQPDAHEPARPLPALGQHLEHTGAEAAAEDALLDGHQEVVLRGELGEPNPSCPAAWRSARRRRSPRARPRRGCRPRRAPCRRPCRSREIAHHAGPRGGSRPVPIGIRSGWAGSSTPTPSPRG